MSIKITRSALTQLQTLPLNYFDRVSRAINLIKDGTWNQIKYLKGTNKLYRTRVGQYRIIWSKLNQSTIILKIDLRRDVYHDLSSLELDSLEEPEIIDHNEKDFIKTEEIQRQPAYQWNNIGYWYDFIYGKYRYSPVLTKEQNDLLFQLENTLQYNNHHYTELKSCLIQSAPGTGKTVCAVLYACELNQYLNYNIIFICPANLKSELLQYTQVKQIIDQNSDQFWVGTYQELIKQLRPDLLIATPIEELEILQKINRNREPLLTENDVILYQNYVLSPPDRPNTIYINNQKQIEYLRKNIPIKSWFNHLGHRLSRIQLAEHIIQTPPTPTHNSNPTMIIIDEAQDFMLTELESIKAIALKWNQQGNTTYLWFLGDLNQRIKPVDFDWGKLQLGKRIEFKYNYRNTQNILKFANQFWEIAQNKNKGKHLPKPTDPNNAFEQGDPVYLLEYPTQEQSLQILEEILKRSGNRLKLEDPERYYLQTTANQVKVLGNITDPKYISSLWLEILNVAQAKGREFETCIAFNIFQGNKEPLLDEALEWYTLLTRPRTRLLIVITTQEITRIGADYFKNCHKTNLKEAIEWITELGSGIDFQQFIQDQTTINKLLAACQSGQPFIDSYQVLKHTHLNPPELYKWEQQAISYLKKIDPSKLKKQLESTHQKIETIYYISWQCLLLRSLDQSWDAVKLAQTLQDINITEYENLIERIALDLENKKLPYEADRIREKIRHHQIKNHPFRHQTQNSNKSLTYLLCKSAINRLNSTKFEE